MALGTETLAVTMEVSVLEAKRLGHRAVLRLSWLLLVASVALSTMLQVAVALPTLVGYLAAGATPVWLLGSFAVLSLLYRAEASADPATAAAEGSAERPPTGAEAEQPGAEVLTKRAQAERVYADLSAEGAPVSAGQLAAAAGLSASYARALIAQFQAQPPTALEANGRRPAPACCGAGPSRSTQAGRAGPATPWLAPVAVVGASGWPARCWSWPRSCAAPAPNHSSPRATRPVDAYQPVAETLTLP